MVEGYREMQLKDEAIDELLASGEYADNLRLFRNATFHFQKDPFSPKVLKFLQANESEIWVRELNRAFKKFFEKELPIENLAAEMGLIDSKSSG
ncbi:MAG: hypothetical protein EON96_10525 [Caulobacteraceae bacterium]|nr:MAG: hypothetical protein EON96_10525 [Caulobacteraceae bacterium]